MNSEICLTRSQVYPFKWVPFTVQMEGFMSCIYYWICVTFLIVRLCLRSGALWVNDDSVVVSQVLVDDSKSGFSRDKTSRGLSFWGQKWHVGSRGANTFPIRYKCVSSSGSAAVNLRFEYSTLTHKKLEWIQRGEHTRSPSFLKGCFNDVPEL